MRVPHALAAVAAFGALVYGVSGPLGSALHARAQAQQSSQAAAQAETAAQAPATEPKASRPTNRAPVVTGKKAKPAAATVPDLSQIARERQQHETSLARTTPATAPAQTARQTGQQSGHRSIPLIAPKQVTRPAVTPEVVTATESYGPSASQRVTVSRLTTASGKRPTVYFIHGGSWIAGSSNEFQAEANRWAAQGWTAVNIDYRLGVPGRLMLGDVRTVVSDFERRPYVNPGKQIIVGASAGGHLATSIAVRYPKEFRGVIAWSPVISPQVAAEQGVHTSTLSSRYRLAQAARRIWGSDWHSATPVSYVTSQTPPLWAAAGQDEWLRWSDQGSLLCTAMGKRCSAHIVPGTAHGAQLAQTHPALRQAALAWATRQIG